MSFDLHAERINRGLTLQALADEIGADKHVLWRAERGTVPVPAMRKRIADFYGVLSTDIWPVAEPDRSAAA